MTDPNRRDFLRLAANAALLGALPASIRRALAVPAHSVTGTINDVQHVVILTQENRSFDHYFGTLRGVRGFRDRHPIPLPGNVPVWEQTLGSVPEREQTFVKEWRAFTPFHLDTARTSAQRTPDLNHGHADAVAAANDGKWDRWVPAKMLSAMPGALGVPRPGLTMGHYHREDLPFQFALADAFTICDAYHCSFHGSTTPNRIFLMTGTNDPHGLGGGPVTDNSSSQTPKNREAIVSKERAMQWDAPGGGFGPRYTFMTYPERLQKAGVTWKVYQDMNDNMRGTLNGVIAFESFAFAPQDSALWKNGMTSRSIADLARDVRDSTLPQVSWIVPGERECEHPWSSSPLQGADYLRQVLEALTANPAVWAKTVLFINFDENDGYFDHVPSPAVPSRNADGSQAGASTIDISGEIDAANGAPYGLGPRVPMYVISPWSRGGWVCSEVFDHTSVIRFLEKRFGVMEPNISAWRRAVCGDLTSAFDFANPEMSALPGLPPSGDAQAILEMQSRLPVPAPPVYPEPLFQESGTKPSRALPYELHVEARWASEIECISLHFRNTGKAAAVLHVYDKLHLERIPRRYTVAAGADLEDTWMLEQSGGACHLWVYGPNGFVREFRGKAVRGSQVQNPELAVRYDVPRREIELSLRNAGDSASTFTITANAYVAQAPWRIDVAPRGQVKRRWHLEESYGWYDFIVTSSDGGFVHRFAGRMETELPGTTEPETE